MAKTDFVDDPTGVDPDSHINASVMNAIGTEINSKASTTDLIAAGSSGRKLEEATSVSYQSGIGTTATDLNGLLITFTVGSRPVLVRAYLPWVTTSTTGASVFGQITDNIGTQIAVSGATPGVAGGPSNLIIEEVITTPGQYTRKVQILRYGGSGTVSNNFSTGSSAVQSRLTALEQ